MRRRNFLFMAIACPLVRAQQNESDPAPPIFRTEVSLITVDAKVTGPGGDISSLNAPDFVIYDEDKAQTPTHFGRETTPIDLLLVLDTSDSMRPFLLELTPHVAEAVAPLRPGDRAGVMLFADRSEVVQPLTDDLKLIPRTTVNTIYKDGRGRSPLVNEALLSAAEYLRSQPATGRRTIIVLTNNDGVRGTVRDTDVLCALYAADSVTNVILVGAQEARPRTVGYRAASNRTPDVFLYAEKTGGDVVTGQEPARALREVIRQATTRYSLQYPAPPGEAGSHRTIRVELSSAARSRYPGATVQARSGYDIPK
jgi:VWFA-related protein